MSFAAFEAKIKDVTAAIAGLPVEPSLADTLEQKFPPGSETFEALKALCRQGIAEGWLSQAQTPPATASTSC
jgi:hypothetical protein